MGKGQLLFKGEKARKKKARSKHTSTVKDGQGVETTAITAATTISSAKHPKLSPTSTPDVAPPTMKKGTGKITTSGTVITGYDTKFEKEVNAGDAILCVLENGKEELRVVTMRLSNISLNLSSAFSRNIKVPSNFHYIRKPRDVLKERAEVQKQKAETLLEQKTHAFDLYANESLVYREKTETGSYRIKREHLDGGESKTRADLLEMRARKTSDKYC